MWGLFSGQSFKCNVKQSLFLFSLINIIELTHIILSRLNFRFCCKKQVPAVCAEGNCNFGSFFRYYFSV